MSQPTIYTLSSKKHIKEPAGYPNTWTWTWADVIEPMPTMTHVQVHIRRYDLKPMRDWQNVGYLPEYPTVLILHADGSLLSDAEWQCIQDATQPWGARSNPQ